MKRILYAFLLLLMALPMSAQEYTQLTNLPTVYIETVQKAAVTDKKTFVNGKWIMVDGEKTETLTGMKIRCRGNSTFNNAGATKKAYRVKFSDKVALLGDKGVADKNWVLMANHFDKSLIRNALTTDIMGRYCGMEFNPGARFVDVVLNGEYIGNYQITDHPDVESGRLDITTPGTDEEASEGFFLEADGWKDHKYVTTTLKSVPVRIHKPKDGEVTSAQADYVKSWLDRFETALFSKDYKDEDKGYRKLVDSVSLANLYLCTEMSANYDGFWSTYLYKRPNDQKMYFGPLWDYDIAYNNDTRGNNTTQRMIVDINTGVCRSWFTRMWRDPWFRQLILRRYNELRQSGIEAFLLHAVDSLGELNAQSAKLNFDKYGINTKVYNEVVMRDTYAEYITDLKTFITDHFTYLDTEIPTRAAASYEDEAREFELNINYFYRVQSVGVKTFFDVTNEALTEGSLAYLWSKDADRRTQQWSIKKVGDAYQFINRASGLALNAPNGDLNTQLNLVAPNAEDEAQLWNIVLASDEASYYNIINKKYERTANVSGGSADNGTKLICWESNEKNKTSTNRQWIIQPDDFNSDEVWDVGDITENLQTEITKYEQLSAGETVGTAPGQVSKASMNKLTSIINEAKGVIDAGKLNKNLMHTYIYYMERAWAAVEESRIVLDPINFDAESNFHLFKTADGESKATAAADFAENNDTPWGFYRYTAADGKYTKFTTFDTNNSKAKAENGTAWYTNVEYCFVTDKGHIHPLNSNGNQASPSIVFKAPEDGIYFATITVARTKSGKTNTMMIRSRYLGDDLECGKDSFMFAKAYGTADIDGANGQQPQTLDFYIRMKQGQRFSFEIDAASDADGRTDITDLAVAACRTEGNPFTMAEAKAYERFYDAIANEPINYNAEGNYKLLSTVEGTVTPAAAFAENNDTPWGFYRYTSDDGKYTRFEKFDEGNSNAKPGTYGKAWYTNVEYCFIAEKGNVHPLVSDGVQIAPSVVFTAPADGIYFATATVAREKDKQTNPLNLRSRFIGDDLECGKDTFIFVKSYGTKDIDEVDGKQPQTLDFFIRMKQGQRFSFEIDAESQSAARSNITNLAVASCRDTDKPFTLEDAEAYPRFFDAAGEPEPVPINFDAEGNYHLFSTAEGASTATADASFAQNNDTPWGFYRYTPADGQYAKFTKFDTNNSKAKSANGTAWYTNEEYCFVTEKGNIHPLASGDKQASPAIAFTAPADGIYFATMTVTRDKNNQTNTLYMRSRCLNNKFKCAQTSFAFEQAYGTAEVDGVDGKVPQTLDFFIKLKQGQTFTFEIDATSDSGARSNINDLAVASCRDKDILFTEDEAKAYERYIDATEAVVNEYTLTYTVDGEVYKTADLVAGATITPEDAPTKEGYSFSGWSEIPATMPAEDLTITGTFAINQYSVKFLLDGQAVYDQQQDYGSAITAPTVADKEGYTFSGWGEVLETVPARDVTFTGSYIVNKYKVSYYVGEQLWQEDEVEYGTDLTLRTFTPEDAARYSFAGWDGETFEKMPAKNLTYTAILIDGIGNIVAGASNVQTIFDGAGRKISKLQRGMNILQMKDGSVLKLIR